MEAGYKKANATNLPKIDSIMMAAYFKGNADFSMAEFRGVKAERSARDSYGGSAVGYVQVKREDKICTVKCKMTPEHRINQRPYSVSVPCHEEDVVLSAQCEKCTVSQGGCKHAIAFLAWLHKRNEDPSSTAVECYWNSYKNFYSNQCVLLCEILKGRFLSYGGVHI